MAALPHSRWSRALPGRPAAAAAALRDRSGARGLCAAPTAAPQAGQGPGVKVPAGWGIRAATPTAPGAVASSAASSSPAWQSMVPY